MFTYKFCVWILVTYLSSNEITEAKRLTGVFNRLPENVSQNETKTPLILLNGECAPPEIKNGKFSIRSQYYVTGQPVPNYVTISFECDEGFDLFPPEKLNTCADGSWYREIPKCYKSCTAPKQKSSLELSCETNGHIHDCTKTVEGTILSMKCKKHYKLLYESPFLTAVCTEGAWDHPLIACVPECGQRIPEGSLYVVKGTSTKHGNFPWHVAIYKRNSDDNFPGYVCGGSIISEKVVLTAAHCLTDSANGNLQPISNFLLAAGKYYSDYDSQQDKLAQKRNIVKIEVPEGYKGFLSNFGWDIALVIIDRPFEFNSVVQPVCVDWTSNLEEEQLRPNNYGQVVGWGFTEDKIKRPSHELKQLQVPYIDYATCIDVVPTNFIKFITTDKFCAGYTNGSSVCQGDSGGGIVFETGHGRHSRFYVRGVVSAGPLKEGSCDSDQYSIYTRVSDYLPFIKRVEALNRKSN